ncbi:MAG: PD-(D/E)XK nuclease family protein, partial [Thauera sp.]|nr:PD-(D/E)XK nuclease family protein [Thauera sp.]
IWFARAFDTLIDQEGALLRMPGRGAALAHFRRRLLRALHTLRSHVRQAGVAAVVPEQALEGRFEGGELAGFADLVMHKAAGAPVVVDVKWSGGKKYPEKLRLNRHLQLALYAELFRQQTGQQPAVAYYLLDRARLLAPDGRGFPEAEVIPSDDDENTAQLWQRFVATWRWRVAQIRAGRFELVLEATSAGAAEDSEPPPEAMAIETLNEAYNDYRTLAGWSNA